MERSNFYISLRSALSLALILFCLNSSELFGQISVQASVRENTVGEEEVVNYDLEIKGVSPNELETPKPPDSDGLRLLQGFPSIQQKMQIINGKVDVSAVFTFRFRPERLGATSINTTVLSIKGESFKTDRIDINVIPQSERPSRSSSRFPNITGNQDPAPKREISKTDAFIRVRNSSSNVYLNQQITLNYDLYVRDNIRIGTSRLADSWDAEGFWREDLETNPNTSARVEVVKGLRYNVIKLKRVAVFPTRTGELTIEPLKIETELSTSRSLPSLFFSRTTPFQAVTLASPSLNINVRPLGNSIPSSYTGVTGRLSVEENLDRREVEVGEPIMYTLTLRGTGKITTISEPALQLPSLIEQYGPEVDYSINRTGNTISGWKKFVYTLIPRSGGQHMLPSIEFTYFNTTSGRFETHRTKSEILNVIGDVLSEDEILAAGRFPGNDIADLIPIASSWTSRGAVAYHKDPFILGMLAFPLLLLGLVFGFRHYTNYTSSNEGQIRSKKAQPIATKALKKAKGELTKGNWKAFYEEIRNALTQFVENRGGIKVSGLSNTELVKKLQNQGASKGLTKELNDLLNECDQATFSPIKPSQTQLNSAIDRASHIISDLHTILG